MKEWHITYTPDKSNFHETTVSAPSYLMALLVFMKEYPNCEFTNVAEIIKNES